MRARVALFVEAGDKPRIVFDEHRVTSAYDELQLSGRAAVVFDNLTDSETVAYLRDLAKAAGDLADQIERAS